MLLRVLRYKYLVRKECIHLYPVFRTFQVGMHRWHQFRDNPEAEMPRPMACTDWLRHLPTIQMCTPYTRELQPLNKSRLNTGHKLSGIQLPVT